MNEVKHAWSAFKSTSKTSTLNRRNFENDGTSTATWYDVPAPIIIHCRDFSNEESEEKRKEKNHDDGGATIGEEENEEKSSESVVEKTERQQITNEALYQNNAEVLASSERSVDGIRSSIKRIDVHPNFKTERNELPNRRHSSTIELTATTSVKTNENGLPTISFSFLPSTNEKNRRKKFDGDSSSVVDEIHADETIDDQLYDFPKNSTEIDNNEVTKESRQLEEQGKKKNGVDRQEKSNNDPAIEIYEIPKSLSDKCVSDIDENNSHVKKEENCSTENKLAAAMVLFKSRRDRLDRTKRSTRSLRTGRRRKSYGNDVYCASMSGSYSDPECPNDSSSNTSRGTSRLKLEKRRLGKAWGKMRNWLKDERSKIGEVVQRHARMQAVGALNGDDDHAVINNKINKNTIRCASYDLKKASRNIEVFGSTTITRVEEFGLASVSEEINSCELVADIPDVEKKHSSDCENVENVKIELSSTGPNMKNLYKKTASSDDILNCANKETRNKLSPMNGGGSVSMDKLCSNDDNDDDDEIDGNVVDSTNVENETSSRERAGKGGMIKRRMLGSIRGLMASTHLLQANEIHEEAGQSGFEDVRRYVKQGGDFCKELASILHERAELEAMYAKGLSKLSSKLTKACAKDQGGNSTGGVNEAWRCVGEEMEAAAEAHRVWGIALGEQLAKPLRIGVAEAQGRSRKSIENSVDKASKSLQEWRGIAAKSKKHSFACARENERLQDLARLQSISQSQQNNNKSSNHHMTEKEANKLETRRRKAEDSSRRADTEFYTVSVRAERARLEYESTVRKGAKQMELLEEERLSALKDLANVYLAHLQALAPRLQQSADRLATPVRNCNVAQDVEILKNLIRRIEGNDAVNAEQLLPDFYAEHITLAMNRERRKQALVRILHLIRQDLERERRGREGLETLHRAFIKTPAFAADESTQNVTEKLHHMRSMLFYLEAARYKVGGTLAEIEGSKRNKHPLAEHILVSRDKQGLQQSVLKIPSWGRNDSFEIQDMDDELEVHLTKDHEAENREWADRTAGDGNSENPPDEEDFSDFDEFSSQSEDNNNQDVDVVSEMTTTKSDGTEQCRAIYHYSANLNDELSLNPGDLITVHQKQADGWWIGECRGRTGIFPATYVQVIH